MLPSTLSARRRVRALCIDVAKWVHHRVGANTPTVLKTKAPLQGRQ
jgi:hypothetical protein